MYMATQFMTKLHFLENKPTKLPKLDVVFVTLDFLKSLTIKYKDYAYD